MKVLRKKIAHTLKACKRLLIYLMSCLYYYGGGFYLARQFGHLLDRRLLILTFHRITDGQIHGLPTISLKVEAFDQLLSFVKRYYQVLPLDQCLHYQEKNGDFPSQCMAITFDDGYLEVQQLALPLLQKHQLPSLMFLPTGSIDKREVYWWDVVYILLRYGSSQVLQQLQNESMSDVTALRKIYSLPGREREEHIIHWINELHHRNPQVRDQLIAILCKWFFEQEDLSKTYPLARAMGWEEVHTLAGSSMSVGPHTLTHQFLTSLEENEAYREISLSRQVLLERSPSLAYSNIFSYPGGHYESKILNMVRQAGYLGAVTTFPEYNGKERNPFELTRMNISDAVVSGPSGKFSPALLALRLGLGMF